jgi:hypothetical protein
MKLQPAPRVIEESSRLGLGGLFGRRGEANDRQQGTDQQHQQVDFHAFSPLSCRSLGNSSTAQIQEPFQAIGWQMRGTKWLI